MRAMTIHQYGNPDVFRAEEIDKPSPGPNDILVRVCASSVNPVDWKIRSGGQRNIIRLRFPWILGLDVSGVVEAIGANVTRFKVGDEVWSSPSHRRPGSYAEYMCINAKEAAKKPKNLSHDEAASIPLVGLTAYQCIVDQGHLARGQTLLVHAGSGGVGAFAIQLGKHLGAHVITTCSAKNADFVRELGAERVVDYTQEDFGAVLSNVDVILDSIGESAFEGNLSAVRQGGRIANISVDVPAKVAKYGAFFSLFALAWTMIVFHLWPWLKKGVSFRHVVKRSDGEQLELITQLVESGAIRPSVERVFPLAEVAEAHRLSATNRVRGKVVLHIAD